MKRLAAIFCLFAVLLVLAAPAAAQRTTAGTAGARAITYPASALANNNFIDARTFHPNVKLQFADVDLATIQGGEPVHSCTGSTGSNSFWLASYLTEGKLTLDTAGSAFVTAGGSIDDTVISLYRLIGAPVVPDFTTLEPIACASGDSGAGKIKTNIIEGTYLVQISLQAAETALDGSEVALLAKFKSALFLGVDEPEGARPLTFPKLYSFALVQHATADLDEPVDPALDPAIPMQKTVWFKFTLTSTNMFYLAGAFGFGGTSVFRVEPGGLLAAVPQPISMTSPGFLLTPGDYYARLGGQTIQMAITQLRTYNLAFYASIVLSSVFLTPVNYSFGTDEGTVGAAPLLDGWEVKNGDVNDAIVCASMQCGFQLHSSGPAEATTLTGKTKLSSVKMKRGEMIMLQIFGGATGAGVLEVTVEFTDVAGVKTAFTREVALTGLDLVPLPINIVPVKSKVTFRNKSKTLGDTVTIDQILIIPYRFGTPLPRGAGVLPLPVAPQ